MKRYKVIVKQISQLTSDHSAPCVVCGKNTYWTGDAALCVHCAADPENMAAELAALRAALAQAQQDRDSQQAEIKELHERLAGENAEVTNCLKNIAELVAERRGLQLELSDARESIEYLKGEIEYWKREWAKDEMTIGSDMDRIQARAERDAATVRGDTYRRRALALAQLCRRLENGERILGTGFSVGAARKFVTNEMTARCADCGQMIMLTVQEYIQRRKDSAK